jgi:hemerythrin-like domain-containing protein
MTGPTDAVVAIHNAFRRDIELIDTAALAAARGQSGMEATIDRFRFFNEVLEWHAHGEDAVIFPLLESVAPSVYETYEQDHVALDAAFCALDQAVSAHDPLETARATKAFKFHLDLHLDKEDTHMYRLISERVPMAEQGAALREMASHAPQDRFPEVVAWMFPLIGHVDRVNMTRSWQMGMPSEGFAMAAQLIEHVVGDDWPALARDIPELVPAT